MRISLILLVTSTVLTYSLPVAQGDPAPTSNPFTQDWISPSWRLPLRGVTPQDISAGFDPPVSHTHGARGHRGVDFPADPGTAVYSVGAGVVFFAGIIAGKPTVSISHGLHPRLGPRPIRSTYEPVVSTLSRGEYVSADQLIGYTTLGNSHCSATCLHLGLKIDKDRYLNPKLMWLHSSSLMSSARG